MTNERNAGRTPNRRLGGALLILGPAIALLGILLLVLDTDGEEPVDQAAVSSPTSTAAPTTAAASPTSTATPTALATPPATPSPTTTTPTPTPTPAPTPPPLTSDDAAAFFQQLVRALTSGDTDFLLANLHPDVTNRYGEATCATYLASVPLETSIQVRDIRGPDPWDWTTNDGFVATYPATWSVDIERLAGSQTLLQVMHIAQADRGITWFTDCGDPGGS